MNSYICMRCGVQYAATVRPPAHCHICEDEREAVLDPPCFTGLQALRDEVCCAPAIRSTLLKIIAMSAL
jgi:hypothetical protein